MHTDGVAFSEQLSVAANLQSRTGASQKDLARAAPPTQPTHCCCCCMYFESCVACAAVPDTSDTTAILKFALTDMCCWYAAVTVGQQHAEILTGQADNSSSGSR
eukprot:16533-Heterococcus_DN1.PRE.2